ncbi:PREDICTED: vitamin K-dependent gamma-carboxylase-like [Priapulus caudatus]|uniref:Vitamin K-dependent gamma-carboxylase-like n=1 Tax=Priapulus caudatus TaxID=37621 RepID=A0ABM1FA81_PRICU|nr:PREDICTED: vitamin K-dependent gamma-carboxylase-like [Priapulus caudatus]
MVHSTRKHQLAAPGRPGRMRAVLGFSCSDFSSWQAFVRLMNRPTDPASLAMIRVFYGLLMFLDVVQERGLSTANAKWGNPDECRFPLFNFLQPLALEWMYMLYLCMWISTLLIAGGLWYRASCLAYCVCYWYLFLLDKTSWNNHSYLYGLISILLLITDANRYWSLDGCRNPSIQNSHVPLWNYTLLRSQIFLVYFIAGLKKTDAEWLGGHSMVSLSEHWTFAPFRLMLTEAQTDYFIVHLGGFLLDLTIGFFLFIDVSRPYAVFFCTSFHLMNAQIFQIGMFPWVMIFTQAIFFSNDWPRRWINRLPNWLEQVLPSDTPPQPSPHCLYSKEEVKPEDPTPSSNTHHKKRKFRSSSVGDTKASGDAKMVTDVAMVMRDKPSSLHQLAALGTVMYLLSQCFLPYSHFTTKGYNNWTNGLYGYSWDMMVHSWSTQHIKISFVNKDTGEEGYLDPNAWTSSNRWQWHADMIKQYAQCINRRLRKYNITNLALYFDVWRSLNGRFQQRMYNPKVDLLAADWSPFHDVTWIMPLLTDLSDWRAKLDELENELLLTSNHTECVFVADFPGLYLENYIEEELGNVSLHVLKGNLVVEQENIGNVSLQTGDQVQINPGAFHFVHTVSATPSCYMYLYTNMTLVQLQRNLTEFEAKLADANVTDGAPEDLDAVMEATPDSWRYMDLLMHKNKLQMQKGRGIVDAAGLYWFNKLWQFWNSVYMLGQAVVSITTGVPMRTLLNTTGHVYGAADEVSLPDV